MDVTTRRLAELKMARRDRAEGVGRTSRRAPAFMQSDDESDDGVLRTRRRRHYDEAQDDDEMEDELDDNLNEIGDVAKRLKNLGMAMGQELDQQNSRIDRLGDKAGGLDQRLFSTTERVCGFEYPIMVTVC